MTVTQKAVIDRYFVDLDSARNYYQLYTAEDKIRGALQLLLDTQDLSYNEYEVYDDRLRKKVWQEEQRF